MNHHEPFSLSVIVLLIAVGVIVLAVASSRRVRPHLPRLGASLGIGAVAAVALVAYVSTRRHAALVASAARPLHDGGHLSATFILADGFVFTMLAVGIIAFAVLTLAARSAAARRKRSEQAGRGAPARAGAWR